jgi:hypothetical protein
MGVSLRSRPRRRPRPRIRPREVMEFWSVGVLSQVRIGLKGSEDDPIGLLRFFTRRRREQPFCRSFEGGGNQRSKPRAEEPVVPRDTNQVRGTLTNSPFPYPKHSADNSE